MSARPGPADRLEDGLVSLALGAVRLLGGWAPRAGARLGRLAYRPFRIRASLVEANLRTAFPDRDPAWIRRTAAAAYAHFGREAVHTLLAPARADDGLVVLEGRAVLDQGLAAGHGVVLLAGHLGNWEVGLGSLAVAGYPLTAVARRQRNPLFDRRINAVREAFGIEVIRRTEAIREALRALRDNRIVLLLADQDARGAGVFVPFFGRPASTPRGPAILAQRSGARLAFAAPLRHPDGRLHVRFEALETGPAAGDESTIDRITAAYVAALERAVRAAPEQYLWHHRRWKTRPPEASAREPVSAERP